MTERIQISLTELEGLVLRVLTLHGLSEANAKATARVIVAGERDECYSHGLYRLLTAIATLRGGGVGLNAKPTIIESSSGIVLIDAHSGFSHLAFEVGSKQLAKKAREAGLAALAIRNCYHFTALWPEVEALAEQGLVCIAMTISRAWVAPAGGRRPSLGTNPFAFAWPRKGHPPYVFDFATSVAARGDIELYRREKREIPKGWGVDGEGNESTNPEVVLDKGAMVAFGGHKGSALSTMIELLAGPLIGELTSLETLAAGGPKGSAPRHGELVLAFDPSRFGFHDGPEHEARAEALFESIKAQGARLPSQRRFEARARSLAQGVSVPIELYNDVLALLD